MSRSRSTGFSTRNWPALIGMLAVQALAAYVAVQWLGVAGVMTFILMVGASVSGRDWVVFALAWLVPLIPLICGLAAFQYLKAQKYRQLAITLAIQLAVSIMMLVVWLSTYPNGA